MYTHEKHTPIDGDYWIIRKDGLLFAKTFSAHDARRIVALGNACEGMPVEVLAAPDYSIKAELDTLDEQIARRLNAEYERNRLHVRLLALEELATAVEADIDTGRPLEYNVEHLRGELIRAREALGILPEQDAVRPKEDHDAQYPIEQHKPIPSLYCRCNIHPVPEVESRQKEPKTVLEMVADYLAEKGYDGLCGDGCGCSLADFPACERLSKDCRPAYRRKGNCKDCEIQCDAYDEDDQPDCYTTEKPEEAQKS